MSLVKRTYVDGETVITADNLNDIQDEIIQNASDISTKGTYSKPSGGIPSTDMTTAVQTSLGKADTAYQKPSGGIPSTDLASAVQTSIGKADTALQSSDIDSTLTVTGKAADAKKTGDEISDVRNTFVKFANGELPYTIIPNEYIETDGVIHTYSGWSRTDYIPVKDLYSITARTSVSSLYNKFYDDGKSPLSGVVTIGTVDTTILIPDNAAFIIFSNTTAGMNNFSAEIQTKNGKAIDENTQATESIYPIGLETLGILPPEKIGYLTSEGEIVEQTSGTNRYYRVLGLHGGESFTYSGEYPNSDTWGLGFSVNTLGTITELFHGAKTGYVFSVPNDCVELRVWGDIRNNPMTLEYNDSIEKKVDEINNIPRFIVVDSKGEGDYASIQSAINYAQSAFNTDLTPVTIFIKNGVYVVEPTTTGNFYAIDKGANKISLIGESRDGTIIRCICTSEKQGIVLNIGGECVIENLTIENLADATYTSETILTGNHRPYCIHNDTPATDQSNVYYTVVKNCKCYSECDTPIGAGMHTNQIQRYENVECVYAANAVIQHQGALYLHGPYSSDFDPIGAEIVDCVLVSKNSMPAISMQNVSETKPWGQMTQTFIRNVTYSTGSYEVDLASLSSITSYSKGNTNSTLNK